VKRLVVIVLPDVFIGVPEHGSNALPAGAVHLNGGPEAESHQSGDDPDQRFHGGRAYTETGPAFT
jgi:hypothetical protein